jgi:hypothetical protein
MSISTKKYLQSIALGAGTSISELTDTTPATNFEALVGMAAGFPEPLFTSLKAMRPDVRFTSPQCQDVLSAINAGGAAPFAADQSAGNTDLWYADAANKASRSSAASTVHQRFRMAKAFLYWERITARHREDAEISCRLKPVWDGANVPIVAAGAQALTVTPGGTQRFTLGPIELNGVQLSGVQEATLESGIKCDEEGSEGELYDSWACIEQTAPVLEITGRTIEWWNTYALGTVLTNATFYLMAKSGTGNVAFGTASHIKLVATAGLIVPAQTNQIKSSTKLRVVLQAPNATTASIAITTGSAIT